MFVPFYYIYWFYKQGEKIDSICANENISTSKISILSLVLSIFSPFIASIVIQSKINDLSKEIQKQIYENENIRKTARKDSKVQMDRHAYFARAAKPYLDAEKLVKQEENYKHFDEIAEMYEESKARYEQAMAEAEEKARREKEEADAYAAQLKAEKAAKKAEKKAKK